MNNKLIYIIVAAVTLSSCKKDFMQLAPQNNLSAATFFKTEAQFDQALIGAYEQLRGIVNPGSYMDEMRSDNTFFNYYAPDRGPANWVEDIILFRDNPQTTLTNSRYRTNYSGIARTNAILDRIALSDLSEAARSRISAEALYLRAFYYFDLVTHYGGVPLHLKDVVSVDEAFVERSSVEEVYGQIISDLLAAIPNLPEAESFPQSGRVTKGAGKMLLAYSYMSKPQREYDKAEVELRDITQMNYSLQDNYADIFTPQNKNNSESIFEIQYQQGDNGQQSDFMFNFLPKTTNSEVLTGISMNVLLRGGWNTPTEEMVSSYEPSDARLPASIAVVEGVQNGDAFTYETKKNVVGYTPVPGKTFYYFINKFLHPPYQREFNADNNWPVFRYAGALLLLAEALVEQGKGDQALPFINEVRERAELDPLTNVTADDVSREMRHELAFENHRFTDLIRTGKAIEVLTAHGQDMIFRYTFIPANSFNVTAERLIYPIPFRELQLNSALVQNPGYE